MIHDGPICHYLKIEVNDINQKEKITHKNDSIVPTSIQHALELAQTLNEKENKNSDEILCDLKIALKNDKSFQSFLNKEELKKKDRDVVNIGLYRLLLELSISNNTNLGTRKRIVSYLQKMDKNEEVELEVLLSIIDNVDEEDCNCNSQLWIDGLISLREWGMEYPASSYNGIISYLIDIGKNMLGNNNNNDNIVVDWSADRAKELATIAKRIMDKVLLVDDDSNDVNRINTVEDTLLYKLNQEVLEPLLIQTTTGESVNALGIATAQILYYKIKKLKTIEEQQENISLSVQQHWKIKITKDHNDANDDNNISSSNGIMNVSAFAKLAWIKGILVTIHQDILTLEIKDQMKLFTIHHSRYANNNDSATRFSALKGLEILLVSSYLPIHQQEQFCHDVIEIIFYLWECPTKNRSITGLLPKLFYSCIHIITTISTDSSLSTSILPRILSQPSYRKGKYQALEVLLPHIGAHTLTSNDNNQDCCNFLHSLVNNLGLKQNLPIAKVMADLWKQILVRHREEEGYIIIPSPNTNSDKKKKRNKNKKIIVSNDVDKSSLNQEQPILPKEWVETYVIPPLKESLLSPIERTRSSISSLCLPLLKDIGNNDKESAQIFQILLESIVTMNDNDVDTHPSYDSATDMTHLWAMLEIIRHAKLQLITSHTFHKTLHTYLPHRRYQASLLHSSLSIRLVAFSIMDYYYYYSPNKLSLQVNTWIYALPYALKSGDKSYVSKLVFFLMSLIVQLNTYLEVDEDGEKRQQQKPEQTLLCQFVSHFIIPKIIINHGSYPGTVYEKELFILLLLKRLLEFFPYDITNNTKVKKKIKRVPPSVTFFRKQCHDYIQQTSLRGCSALRDSVVTTLLFSMWDTTRLAAYDIVLMLDDGYDLLTSALEPSFNTRTSLNWRSVICRGIYLSSSPRQREADTGAKILAIYHKLLFLQYNYNFLEQDLIPLVQDRLDQILGVVAGDVRLNNENADNDSTMPLAHGLIHAMQLIVGQQKLCPTISPNESNDVFKTMIDLCCRSMEISLTLVADVGDDEYDEHNVDPALKGNGSASQKYQRAEKISDSNVPLNVNTGAIGANAIIATLSPDSEEDRINRATLQRMIVGSWLLIKQACAALSMILSNMPPSSLSSSIVSKCGSLLLSTLISLKHQGAAFAAHKTFQVLCYYCYPPKNHNSNNEEEEHLKRFPMEWATKLIREISSELTTNDIVEKKVRDSTLRRSIGYALGFLAIVRSEIFSSASYGLPIFHTVMAHLIRLSLPCCSEMKTKLKKLGGYQNSIEETLVYRKYLPSSLSSYTPDEEYEWKSRVHALNILRLAIMDAPLAKEIHTFAGDAIFSSLLGYNDFNSWAVRNSSTMVFSSVMLRVIDADKNAQIESIVAYSENTGSSAVTAKELFRKYPFLSPFLVSSLEQSNHYMKKEENNIDPSLVYAILLLLARLQPASSSSVDVGANDVIVPLIKPLLKCLTHSYHKVRIMASRALAALCTDEVIDMDNDPSSSSRTALLQYSLDILRAKVKPWNCVHGALLAIQALVRPVICQPEKLSYLEIRSDLLVHIQYYSSWCDWTYACPPTCVAVALDIYFDCQSRYRNEGGPAVDKIASKIISVVEKMKNDSIDLIGLSYLGAIASKISCSCCFSDLRSCFSNQLESDEVPNDSILNIQTLFESSFFDVRISSIKTFKKLLFLQLSQGDKNQPRSSIFLLSQICHMLLSSLRLELEKYEDDNHLIYHASSLRRLSRSLIDCICYMQHIVFMHDDTQSKTLRADALDAVRCNWSLFLELKRIGGSVPEDDTTLGGNALELMAFSLSLHLNSRNVFYEESDAELESEDRLSSMLQNFVHAIKQSLDPTNEWKIRYSGALAISSSGVLNLLRNHDEDFHDSSTMQSSFHTFCLDLYIELLKLLQDGDEDVREAAGKAVSRAIDAIEEESDFSCIKGISSVPLFALEKSYADVCAKICFSDKMKFLKVLADQLSLYCKTLTQDLKIAVEEVTANEMVFSTELSSADENKRFYSTKLMNLSTRRKVFEDENPNIFEEKLVIMQLNIATVLRLHEKHTRKDNIDESFQQLLCECQSTLQFLVDVYCNQKKTDIQYALNQDVLHDLTRCQSIFPRIYVIFLGSASAFIHSNCKENNDRFSVSQMNTNASMLIKCGANFFHPHIVAALEVLVRATSIADDTSRASTYEDICGCCFLLPTLAKN